jgi:DNA-binding transcriptional regulator LsrR (DeoR family)
VDDGGHASLLAVARLYYEDDLSQQQIAERLGVSRSTVSRLLQTAREEGIVQIEIRPPTSVSQLGSWLQGALKLRRAVVVPPPPRGSGAAILVGPALAEVERLELRPGDVLAVSAGETVWEIARGRGFPSLRGVRVVPALGGVDSLDGFAQANELARLVASAGGGEVSLLHAPLRPGPSLYSALLGDPELAARLASWDGLAAALVGIEEDVAGRRYELSGDVVPEPLIAVAPQQLQAAGTVIGVASGTSRAASIIGAARAGLLDVLVTDAPTASATLDVLSS